MSNRKIKAIMIITWSFLMQIGQTKYFGTQIWPSSIAEIIFDAIFSASAVYGFYLFITKKTPTPPPIPGDSANTKN